MNQDNGGIIGKINTPTTSVASGVWSIEQQFEAQSSSTWPLAFPQTTFTNACRFNSDAYMVKNNESPTNQKKYTINVWVKRSVLSSRQRVFTVIDTSSTAAYSYLEFQSDDTINFDDFDGSSTRLTRTTNRVFRDPSAWYNIIIAVDTTESTASDRVKMYINGVQETSFSGTSNASQDFNTTTLNSSKTFRVGEHGTAGFRFGGYMTEFILIDGQRLDQTSFGATNPVTNIWEPIAYVGTYGNNGFKLTFADSSALGDDTSGNGNDFTVTSLASTDQSTDTCSNNFATLNHLTNASYHTLAEGNLQSFGNTSSDQGNSDSTISASSGKWYAEVKCVATNTTGGTASYPRYGIRHINNKEYGTKLNGGVGSPGKYFANEGLYQCNALKFANDTTSSFGNSFTANDIIGIAVDYDNGAVYVSKNGTYQNSGNPASGSSKTGALLTFTPGDLDGFVFACAEYNDSKSQWNFGSPPYAISSGNADANGHGNFEYAVPSDYFALCTKNLSEHG